MRQAADSAGLLIGAAVRPQRFQETRYAATLAREFNLVEPEDALKWATLHPSPQTYDFYLGDEVVAFAAEHGMRVRGHTLVWDHNNPAWLESGHYAPAELGRILREHITTVMRHYRGKVFAWDVINEGFNEHGNVRSSIWYDRPGIGLAGQGTSYIEQCFRWAREADPDALLFYNDAEGEGLGIKSDAIYAMVKDFRRRGVPIDGVGLQMHVENLEVSTDAVSANIERLTALGVQVHITELDVSIPVDAAGDPAHIDDLAKQAGVYRRIATACIAHRGCTAIQTWGFADKYSWIGWHSRGKKGAALPFDREYRPKPAYDALLETMSKGRGH